MKQNVEQHQAFHPGFIAFRDYCRDTTSETYDAKVFTGIVDSFATILRNHLAEEIDTLLALDCCDEGELKKAYTGMEGKMIATADKVSLLISFILS